MASYRWPIQTHGSIGPSCGVADVRGDGATVWSSSQATHNFCAIGIGGSIGSGPWGAGSPRAATSELSPPRPAAVLPRVTQQAVHVAYALLEKGAHFYPAWKVRTELGVEGLCQELRHAYDGTEAVYVHFDMDVLGGAGPAPGDILGELAEPIGLTDYEVIRVAFEIGKRGLTGISFICIPPGSAVVYRTIVYVVMYLLAGRALAQLRR